MKLWLNRILDFLLWMAFCLMLATGFIIRYRLPPGRQGGHGLSIWGWDRHDWGDLHTWMAYTVGGLIVVHLLLHWRWMWFTALPRWKWPVLAGLLAGLLLAASAWFLPVQSDRDEAPEPAGRAWRGGRE